MKSISKKNLESSPLLSLIFIELRTENSNVSKALCLSYNLSMNIGILGSGFGVYGYLPAVCKNLWTPIILEKNRYKIEARPELFQHKDRITYVDNEKTLIESSHSLIIATTHTYQTEFLKLNNLKNINHLYLEKPISPTLKDYFELIQYLKLNKTKFSVAYLFIYSSWYLGLKKLLQSEKSIDVAFNWSVKKIESTWKNSMIYGGGLLYFYGIHFLALLNNLEISMDDIEIIEDNDKVLINVTGLQKIKISINYAKNSYFSIKVPEKNLNKIIYENQTPFGLQNKLGTEDTRVNLIAEYLKDLQLTPKPSSIDIEEYIYDVMKSRRKNNGSVQKNYT